MVVVTVLTAFINTPGEALSRCTKVARGTVPPARPAAPAFGIPGEQSGDNGLERSVRSQGDDTEAAAAPRAASTAEAPEAQQAKGDQRGRQTQQDPLEVRMPRSTVSHVHAQLALTVIPTQIQASFKPCPQPLCISAPYQINT